LTVACTPKGEFCGVRVTVPVKAPKAFTVIDDVTVMPTGTETLMESATSVKLGGDILMANVAAWDWVLVPFTLMR
jgi:hypothetical protein